MRLVYGVGVNDADYLVAPIVGGKQVMCPFYKTWKSMLERGYSKKFKIKRPTYESVSVCGEWLTFSNFKGWMETQDWEGNQLDKDLLIPSNKVYSPETCVFVSAYVNTFTLDNPSKRGKYPIGVSMCRGRYKAMCGFDRNTAYIGTFDTVQEASDAYMQRKRELASTLAGAQTDKRVADAILQRYALGS